MRAEPDGNIIFVKVCMVKLPEAVIMNVINKDVYGFYACHYGCNFAVR